MRFATSAAISLTLVLAACSNTPKPGANVAPRGVGLETEVIEQGGEPREKLRYTRAAGLTEDLVIQLGLATLLESREGALAVQPPVLTLGLTMGAVAKVSEGVWSYPFSFKVIGVAAGEGADPAMVNELTTAVAPLSAVKGEFEVDDRGITRRADVDMPRDASARLLAMLGNIRTSLITVPLPEQEIGVGARWKVQRLNQVGRITTTQTMTYSLLERKGQLLRLGVTLQQSAAPQEVPFGDDATLQIEAYEVSGTGSMVIDLAGITPLSELRGTSDLRAMLKRGAAVEPLQANGTVEIVVEPLKPVPAG
jgi:hypothetical protein